MLKKVWHLGQSVIILFQFAASLWEHLHLWDESIVATEIVYFNFYFIIVLGMFTLTISSMTYMHKENI